MLFLQRTSHLQPQTHKKPAAFYFIKKKYNPFNTEFCPLFFINSNKTSGNIYYDYFSLVLTLLFY